MRDESRAPPPVERAVPECASLRPGYALRTVLVERYFVARMEPTGRARPLPPPPMRQGNRILKRVAAAGLSLPLAVPLRGGWLAQILNLGQSGGGNHNGTRACGNLRASFARLDHPGLHFLTMLRIAVVRIADAKHRRSIWRRRPKAAYALPKTGRDRNFAAFQVAKAAKHASISPYAIARAHAGRGRSARSDSRVTRPNAARVSIDCVSTISAIIR